MTEYERVEDLVRLPSKLPSGWTKSSLTEVAEIIMGQSPSSMFYNKEGNGLPFFQGKAEFGDLYPEAVKWCTEPGKIAQKDDVLISVRAPVGPTNLAPSECCIGRGLAAIRPQGGMPSKYILNYLRSIERDIDALGTGTTFKAISGKTLREIPVPIAPLDQQKRIVAEIEKQFSRLDEAVANLKRIKANLKRYKAAVLKAAVEGKLTEEWRKAHPDVEPATKLLDRILTERRVKWSGKGKYKESRKPEIDELPALPKNWTWTTVDQLTSMVTSGSRGWGNYYSDTGPLFIRAQDIKTDSLKLENVARVRIPTNAEGTRTAVANWDVLITITGANVTKAALVRLLSEQAFVSQHVALLKPCLAAASPYLFTWVVSPAHGRRILERWAYGAGKPGLSLDQVRSLPVALPPLDEQNETMVEVERRLSIIEELETTVEANLTRANRLRQAILQSAFTGQLVPQGLHESAHLSSGSNSKGSTPVIQAWESTKMTQHF